MIGRKLKRTHHSPVSMIRVTLERLMFRLFEPTKQPGQALVPMKSYILRANSCSLS